MTQARAVARRLMMTRLLHGQPFVLSFSTSLLSTSSMRRPPKPWSTCGLR